MSTTVLSLERLGPPAVQDRLEARFDCWLVGRDGDLDSLLRQLAERVTAIVTTGGRGAEKALIERLPRLQLIACYGVGVDAIDLDAARSRGVAVTNTPDVLTDDVADLAVLLYGAQRRRLVEADRWVRSRAWETQGAMPLGRAMRGRRVGLLGFGRIGQAIASRLTAFGAEVRYHKPTPRDDDDWPYAESPVALAEQCDDLVVCCRGGPTTRNLVDAAVLRALGADGVLVNVARGSVIDEAALTDALQDGVIAGAALDVFAEEPWVPALLRQRRDVVLAPHIGSATVETRTAMGELVLRNLDAHAHSSALVTPV